MKNDRLSLTWKTPGGGRSWYPPAATQSRFVRAMGLPCVIILGFCVVAFALLEYTEAELHIQRDKLPIIVLDEGEDQPSLSPEFKARLMKEPIVTDHRALQIGLGAIFMSALGAVACAHTACTVAWLRRARTLPRVQAEVLESNLEEVTVTADSTTARAWAPALRCRYEYEGAVFERNVATDQSWFNRSEAEQYLQEHTSDGRCELSIDPEKAGEPLFSASLEHNPMVKTLFFGPLVAIALTTILFSLSYKQGAWRWIGTAPHKMHFVRREHL